MKRVVIGVLSVVALAFAAPASADAPFEVTVTDVFPDVNPCTGTMMTVTIVATVSVHEHGSRASLDTGRNRCRQRPSAQVQADRHHDERRRRPVQARGVFVLDLKTDTARVDNFELICLGAK